MPTPVFQPSFDESFSGMQYVVFFYIRQSGNTDVSNVAAQMVFYSTYT